MNHFSVKIKFLTQTAAEQLQLLSEYEAQAIEDQSEFNETPYELRLGGCGCIHGPEQLVAAIVKGRKLVIKNQPRRSAME